MIQEHQGADTGVEVKCGSRSSKLVRCITRRPSSLERRTGRRITGILASTRMGARTMAIESEADALGSSGQSSHRVRPFLALEAGVIAQSPLRAEITAAYRRAERECLPPAMELARLDAAAAGAAQALAKRLVLAVREKENAVGRQGLLQGLLREFSLSSQEGVALMCLAEALLRIPDRSTREALIRDKLSRGDWRAHLGQSDSLLVNAAAWGLLVTGRLVTTTSEASLTAAITGLFGKGGAPLILAGVDMAVQLMSRQFVAGESIESALANTRERQTQGFRFSYDMLGEAALTAEDAERYFGDYAHAIRTIGTSAGLPAEGFGLHERPGISVKLSALHPRYCRAQRERVMGELQPRLKSLASLARSLDIGLNIDAEESFRLDLSLDLLEALCRDPDLEAWNGIGMAVQAYQRRAPQVIDWLIDIARQTGRRLTVRLVKGAYWDSEIKRAQVEGLNDYPVFTRKAYTDVVYLACARKLLGAQEAVYPQFATHNAHSLATIYHLVGPSPDPSRFEFQCLHGMGEPLYEEVVGPTEAGKLGCPCRIYAPVGSHRTLLPYLVRRLLENGANSSFVHRIADKRVPLDDLLADPVALAAGIEPCGAPHSLIPLPGALYGDSRANSAGIDLSDESELIRLSGALERSLERRWLAGPMLATERDASGEASEIRNPADHRDIVGRVVEAAREDVLAALDWAERTGAAWERTPATERARILERAADLFQAERDLLISLAVREAGKTLPNAVAEIREAVDYLRYYAAQIRTHLSNAPWRARGLIACISPWNFPLAIFTGQVGAALGAGNIVIAKPAEQTPLVAAEAVRLLRHAGVPPSALQLLPGRGETVGAMLVADPRVQGVMFTGSTEVAKLIQRSIAKRLDRFGQPVALIAETGGQNAMIADSSALPEQVATDVLQSAYDSAGQRCSSLRMLYVQEETAERILQLLTGALRELRIGPPDRLATDIGPVIDAQARESVLGHIERMRAQGRRIVQVSLPADADRGTYVAPTIVEIGGIGEIGREVFGPVLHVARYRRDRLDDVLEEIAAVGYGLTLGIHTRVDETIARIASRARVGNIYVNRNMIGATVGVQPFGGEGLSGTGPKAGGPLYLPGLLREHVLPRMSAEPAREAGPALAYRNWLRSQGKSELSDLSSWYLESSPPERAMDLPGPTGESNTYSLHPRGRILCLADTQDQLLAQLAAVFAAGNHAVLEDRDNARALRAALPAALRTLVLLVQDWTRAGFEHVLFAGPPARLLELCDQIAARPGPIIGVQACADGPYPYVIEPLLIERSLSVNTAAAGGNASLMSVT
ncbi:MAG: trifunctional transcriptional regulator/proline dehydrogenase/L-glutamate gamma-semialdehyde dehydrogenase [Betaproteobacteria bacterium]|nr:trifunctional transcriptional regulator/proline dehydrogenase/L-glutamate gamma-semialdehyde dehydrogenase [Betaproteobacteria bacterium]